MTGPNLAQKLTEEHDTLVGDFEGVKTRNHIVRVVIGVIAGDQLAIGIVHGPIFGNLVAENLDVRANL